MGWGALLRPGALGWAAFTAVALSATQARASLLEEPPNVCTFDLDAATPPLPLLESYRNAEIERPGPMRLYLGSRWGRWREQPWWQLAWWNSTGPEPASDGPTTWSDGYDAVYAPQGPDRSAVPLVDLGALWQGTADGFAQQNWFRALDPEWLSPALSSTGRSFASNGFDRLWITAFKKKPDFACRRRAVSFVRYGGEQKSFELVECDGSVATGALDHLSIMMRPPDASAPSELLPDEPDADAWQKGEWVAGVRTTNPRLLWLLQRIADAFPRRTFYIFSGYRPAKHGAKGHQSLHATGRAIDIHVMGVPNAALFKVCRTLDDVGCGYYPNSKFVHVDVRRPGTGRAFWVDVSGPGEPSKYVDSWPGVVDRGAMVWDATARNADTDSEPAPSAPVAFPPPPSMGSHTLTAPPP